MSFAKQSVPARAPQHLDDVPAGPPEVGLELLDDLAIAPHWPVETLQVAVDDEDEVVELLASCQRDRAQALRLVHLAVAHEGPDLASLGLGQAPEVQILEEAGLVDRHEGAKPHRDGRKLPEVRHQPWMRIGRQALAVDLLTEAEQLLLGEAALKEGAGIDAWRGMALNVDEIAAMLVRGRTPEMHEAGVVEGCGRLEAGNVASEFGGLLVGLEHDGESVPADGGSDPVLDCPVSRMRLLLSTGIVFM